MRRRPIRGMIIAAAAMMLGLAGCSGGDAGAAGSGGNTLTIASVAGSTGDTALSLAAEHGIFEEHGFTLERVTVQSAPAALAAAQSGQVDIAYAPSIPLLNAISKGISLHIVAAADGYRQNAMKQGDLSEVDNTSLFASKKSGITEVSELKGKKIAIPARDGQFEVVVTQLLAENGIGADEVQWIVLDYQSALTALKSGEVDAATLLVPFNAKARDAGMTYLAAPSVEFFQHGAVGLWSTGDKVASDTDRVNRIQEVIVAANQYANDHLKEAKNKTLELTGADLNPEEMVDPYWPLTVQESDIERVNTKLAELGFLTEPVDLEGVVLPQADVNQGDQAGA